MQTHAPNEPIKVLLIEDDEDDFILTKGLFTEIAGRTFQLACNIERVHCPGHVGAVVVEG